MSLPISSVAKGVSKESNPRQENLSTGPCPSVPAGWDQNRYDVCEVFSPPRICAAATEQGWRGGWPVDISIRDPSTGRRLDLRNSKDPK